MRNFLRLIAVTFDDISVTSTIIPLDMSSKRAIMFKFGILLFRLLPRRPLTDAQYAL